jgi:hypothetical protein
MRAVLILVAAFLVACSPPARNLPPREQEAVSAALSGWREAGLPEPSPACRFDRVRVVRPDEEGYVARCSQPSAGFAGCTSWDYATFGRDRAPVVVAAPWWLAKYGERDMPALIVHELMHALTHCAMPSQAYLPANREHLDPRVWLATGRETSAQGRAMALIRR